MRYSEIVENKYKTRTGPRTLRKKGRRYGHVGSSYVPHINQDLEDEEKIWQDPDIQDLIQRSKED